MSDSTKVMAVEKNRLLYDEDRLTEVREELEEDGIPPKPTEIKQAVKTDAFVYEIRTAMTFWFGGRMSHRESEQVWQNCEEFEKENWTLDNDANIVYEEDN